MRKESMVAIMQPDALASLEDFSSDNNLYSLYNIFVLLVNV